MSSGNPDGGSGLDIGISPRYKDLLRNPHFARYYRTWEKNDLSIVFIPLAQICREQGFLDEAKEICEKGLERHPTSVAGRLMLARILSDREEMARARAVVETVVAEFPGQQEAQTLLQRIKRSQGTIEEDEEITEVAESPDNEAPLWENVTMAKIYADQGDTKVARQMVERILTRTPQDPRALALREELSR